jgi:copper chaperone NosL
MTRSQFDSASRPRAGIRAAVAVLALLGAGAAGLAGCSGATPEGPPEIRLGRDQCTECGMIINEDRCSCASRVDLGQGAEMALFDDIGCMLEHERLKPESKVLTRYVHDHTTRQWLEADKATFLLAESVRTPMGSGIVAYASKDAAEAAKKEHPGEVYDFAALAAARKKAMEEQFGTPK